MLSPHGPSSIPDQGINVLQCAYRPNRSTEDTITHLLHSALNHLDTREGNHVKTLHQVRGPRTASVDLQLPDRQTSSSTTSLLMDLISANDQESYLEEIKSLKTKEHEAGEELPPWREWTVSSTLVFSSHRTCHGPATLTPW